MRSKNFNQLFLFLLAIVFSTALIFSSLEFPSMADTWLQKNANFPGYDQQASSMHISKAEMYLKHYNLKLYGYVGLGIVISLIIIGFITNKRSYSLVGAFAIFLPIFGHFALTMFFLAGLGFFRILWIPFTEISPIFMRLGDIILLPYELLVYLGEWLGLNLNRAIPIFFIASGVALFTFGVFIWLSTKFGKKNVAKSWIYKISRHPQYLGWIIWSYGLFLMPIDHLKKSWEYPDTLPWLLSTMVIIVISLLEEINMRKKYGNDYENFKKKTSFMFPIPMAAKRIIKSPLRLFFRKTAITSKRQALIITAFYTGVFMFASYIIIAFTDPSVNNIFLKSKRQAAVRELIENIKSSENRRTKDIAAMELEKYKELAYEPLIETLSSKNPEVRYFTLRCLNKLKNQSTKKHLASLLNDSNFEFTGEYIKSVAIFKIHEAEQGLIDIIKSVDKPNKGHAALALSALKAKYSAKFMLEKYFEEDIYTQAAYIESLGMLQVKESEDLIISQLQNDKIIIKEAAIVALANIKSKKALQPLKEIELSNDWERAVYASEAIKIIEN